MSLTVVKYADADTVTHKSIPLFSIRKFDESPEDDDILN